MQNSAKERIKDVQTKQEPRDMLLCADTQLHRETEVQAQGSALESTEQILILKARSVACIRCLHS